jgi:adenosylcobinamide-phosphate synthase
VGAIGYLIEVALNPLPWLWLLVAALLLKPMFAVRALRDAAFAVRDALEAGDLERARHGLRSLCSRDASQLGESDLSAATIESVAENASDSIVAPLLFFAVFGLPGAAIYRTVNTLDAMIGYRGRFEWAGKASARLDDVLNLVPARVTAWSFMLVAEASGGNLRKGIATWWRDAGRTESPNAGRPMAAMAGLLGVRLNKQGHYTLGAEHRPARAEDISRAWRIVSLASTLVALLSALLAGALHG